MPALGARASRNFLGFSSLASAHSFIIISKGSSLHTRRSQHAQITLTLHKCLCCPEPMHIAMCMFPPPFPPPTDWVATLSHSRPSQYRCPNNRYALHATHKNKSQSEPTAVGERLISTSNLPARLCSKYSCRHQQAQLKLEGDQAATSSSSYPSLPLSPSPSSSSSVPCGLSRPSALPVLSPSESASSAAS